MAVITVRKGIELIIDDDKYEELSKLKYTTAGNYIKVKINNKYIPIHRYLTNCPSDMVVDHINMNKLDNRLCNLEIVTRSENSRRNAEAMYHLQEIKSGEK